MKTRFKPIFNIFTLVALLVSLFGSAAFVTPVYAAGIVVNSNADTVADDGTCTLREAITNANGDSQLYATAGECATGVGSDTITFDAPLSGGTIYLASTLTLSNNVTIDGSVLASPITLSGDTDNNGTGDVRVFLVNSGVTATLNSLVITKGAINYQSYGGGIYNSGTLTVTNSTFSGNYAGNLSDGGGIYNNYKLTVANSTFSSNFATFAGGGIGNSGTLTVTNSTLSGNSAVRGGGIDNYSGTLTVTNSTLSGNSADHGGGIFNYSGSASIVTNSTLSGNSASYGGGIGNFGTLTVTNSTISGNSAFGGGGGILNVYGTLNYANTIIANSSSGGDCKNSATIETNTKNLVEDGTCSANGINFITGDPNLSSLADNGGPTQTFALLPGSSAIDAGDSTVCSASAGDPNYGAGGLDQRGVARSGPVCDIGAFEVETTFNDVWLTHWANSYIERLYNAGITGGCVLSPLQYCPDSTVTRAQMAVFLLKGMHGSSFTPPAVGASTGFTDVATNYWAAAWIKQLAAEGVTGGCGSGNYCPDATVTRAQMAVFLLKAKHGLAFTPPAATGVFTDVPVGYWADKWIEQLASEGITGGCGGGNYCPDADVTRAQMAVFLVKAFNLP